jgi:hypothetical protein
LQADAGENEPLEGSLEVSWIYEWFMTCPLMEELRCTP